MSESVEPQTALARPFALPRSAALACLLLAQTACVSVAHERAPTQRVRPSVLSLIEGQASDCIWADASQLSASERVLFATEDHLADASNLPTASFPAAAWWREAMELEKSLYSVERSEMSWKLP